MNKFAVLMLVAATQAIQLQTKSEGPLEDIKAEQPELLKELESHIHDDPELIAILEEHQDEIAQWVAEHKDDDKAVDKVLKKMEEHLHE